MTVSEAERLCDEKIWPYVWAVVYKGANSDGPLTGATPRGMMW